MDLNPKLYLTEEYMVLDFETTNKDHGDAGNLDNSLLLACWWYRGTAFSASGNEYTLSHLAQKAEEIGFVVAHNAKFELKWLRRMGADLSKITVYDTMLCEYVLNGNQRVPLSLGEIAVSYGLPNKEEYIDLCIKSGICPSELPKSLVLQRCKYDVAVTRQVFLKQRHKLYEQRKLPVFFTRCILTPALADIESNGMNLDKDKVTDAYYTVLDEYNRASIELDNITGGINLNSPKQLTEFLYDTLEFKEVMKQGKAIRTATGNRSASSAVVAALKARTAKQKKFKELQGRRAVLNAALTKALNKFMECCDNDDIMYAVFNQSVTATHRLSSSGARYKVQFQNLARRHKPLFTARTKGWLMAEIDGAQLEFRVAAFLGQDTQAMLDIDNHVDVHTFTADTLTEAGQETSRQVAKAHTFKPLYGGSSGTKAERTYYAAFKARYPGITRAQQNWIDQVLSTKVLRIASGLEFFWPDTKIQRSGYVVNTQNICNYPVQSLATADIIPIAIVGLWIAMREAGLESFIVNTVHDSVILEVHPEETEIIKQLAVDNFGSFVYTYLKEVYNINFNVTLGVGIKLGEHWSIGEEETFDIKPEE